MGFLEWTLIRGRGQCFQKAIYLQILYLQFYEQALTNVKLLRRCWMPQFFFPITNSQLKYIFFCITQQSCTKGGLIVLYFIIKATCFGILPSSDQHIKQHKITMSILTYNVQLIVILWCFICWPEDGSMPKHVAFIIKYSTIKPPFVQLCCVRRKNIF
jgi:hypothetical protein